MTSSHILTTLEVYGQTVPHWKALRNGKDGSRELSCGSTSSICQGILKSHNLLHKQGFVKTQSLHTVNRNPHIENPNTTPFLNPHLGQKSAKN